MQQADSGPDARRFRALFSAGGLGQVDLDLTGRVVAANRTFRTMLGLPDGDLPDGDLPDVRLLDPEQGEDRELLDALLTGEHPTASRDRPYTTACGRRLHLRVLFAVLRDAAGVPELLTAVVADRTAQELVRQDLARAARTLEAVLDEVSDGVVAVDADGRVVLRNSSAAPGGPGEAPGPDGECATFEADGVSPLELARWPLTRALSGERCPAVRMVLEDRRRPGERRTVDVTAAPLQLGEGRPGAVSVVRDVSATVRLQADLLAQQHRLQAVLDTAVDAFIGMDRAGLVTDWNPAAEAMFGWRRDEAVGRRLSELVVPERLRAAHEAAAASVLAGGPRRLPDGPVELVGRHRDGSDLPVELVLSPLHVGTGHVYGFVRDIRQRRREQALTGTLAQVVQCSGDAVLTVDLDGVVTSWNLAAERLYGFPASATVGRSARPFLDLVDAQALDVLCEQVHSTGQPSSLDTRLASSPPRELAMTVSPLVDDEGRPTGFACMARDVTEQLQVQDELRRTESVSSAAFDAAITGMTIVGLDGRYRRVNRVFAEMLGVEPQWLVGRSLLDVSAPGQDSGLALMRRVLRGEISGFTLDKCFQRPDGTQVWAQVSSSLVRGADGQPAYFANQYVDRTEQRLAQRQRDTHELMLRGVIANSQSLIYVKDLQGRYLLANEPFQQTFGVSEQEMLGRTDDYLDPQMAPIWRENDVRAQHAEVRVEERASGPDGALVYESVKFPLRDPDGAVYATCGVSLDVTAQRRAVQDMAAARDQAIAATAAKSAFLATMSHEIRTPLNAVIGMTGLLLDTGLTSQQQEFAETVRDSGESLLSLINDILDFSKIEAGELELEHQPFSLRDCLDSALSLVALPAAGKQLELVAQVAADCPDRVLGDVTRLRQVLVNLLSNAVKFTERGEITVTLDGTASPGTRLELAVAVADTGIGIPPDRLGRLFRSFSQVDSSTTRLYGGSGLGLAISSRLAEAMGGALTVTSVPGAGSTFTLTTGLDVADDQSSPEPAEPVDLRGRRVLIVDDHAANRRVLRLTLERWGMVCTDLAAPEQALRLVAGGAVFDIAALDQHMPGMSGEQLAGRLRELPAGRDLPMVLLSSVHDRLVVDGSPFAAVLSKPTRTAALLDGVRRALGGSVPVAVEPGPAPPAQRPLRVLLAEDNVVNQKVAQLLLGRLGHRVDTVGNGQEAVEALHRAPYDVVLMDVQMPVMDGLAATRAIREQLPGPRQPYVVALTANALLEDRAACTHAGMDAYLTKPVRVPDLEGVLARVPADRAPRPPAEEPLPDEGRASVEQRLEELSGHRGADARRLFAPVLRAFVEQAPDLAARLHAAHDSGDTAAVAAQAHRLRGSASSIGANGLAGHCARLEAGAPVDDSFDETVTAACRSVSEVVDALEQGAPALR